MESVGQKLRAARSGLGLRLEDVNAATRINLKCLSALEADDFDGISCPFLYKSFVRQVAAAVGLTPETLQSELDVALVQFREPLVPGQAGAPAPPKLPSLRTSSVRLSRWISSFAMLFIMLAGCSMLYATWERSRGSMIKGLVSALHSPGRAASESAGAFTTTVPSGHPVLSVAPAPVRIEVSALERTWVSVVTDGKQAYAGTMQVSERKSLESRNNALVRTANAGAVEIVFNGKKLGALGSRGQGETVEFQKDGYRIVQPADSHLALASLGFTSGQ